MASQHQSTPQWKSSPFGRARASPSPGPPPGHARSRSTVLPSTMHVGETAARTQHGSFADLGLASLERSLSKRHSVSGRASTPNGGTFAPKFIKTDQLDGAEEKVGGIEGENDFSGKRYVWIKDPEAAFIRGWVSEELANGHLLIQCDDGSVGDKCAANHFGRSADI